MTRAIRVYVEGGGDGADTKAAFRLAFIEFAKDLATAAHNHGMKLRIIACGSRNSTADNFRTALATHSTNFNILLVDSEGPVTANPVQYLQNRDRWELTGVADNQCHLMVQLMETWFLADTETLKTYYGQRFTASALPRHANVEQVNKAKVMSSLEAATRHTQKGRYHKTRHGPNILKRLNAARVRRAAPHCDRLFTTIEAHIHG